MSSNKQTINTITNEFNNYRNDCSGPNSNYYFGNNKKSCYIPPSPHIMTEQTRNRSTSVRIKKIFKNVIPDRSSSISGSRRRWRLRSYSYHDDYYDHDKNNNNKNNNFSNHFSPNFNIPFNDKKIKTKTNSCKYNCDTKFKDDTYNADDFQASENIIKRVNGEGKKGFCSSVSFVKGVG